MRNVWITSGANALRCVARGDEGAPAVAFVHGIGGNADVYSSLLPGADFLGALADEGLWVVAVDLQGHGLSEGRRGHLPFEAAMRNIRDAVAWVRERAGAPVALCGSGLGGILSLYAALGDANVGAVAAHTAADLRSIAGFEPRARRRAIAWIAGETARRAAIAAPLVRLPLRALFPPTDFFEDVDAMRAWRAFPRIVRSYTLDSLVSIFLSPDDKPSLEALDKPVMVITGDDDRVVPLAGQADVVSTLPDADLQIIGGAGHMLPLEHCAETASRIGNWLRKVL